MADGADARWGTETMGVDRSSVSRWVSGERDPLAEVDEAKFFPLIESRGFLKTLGSRCTQLYSCQLRR